MNRAVKLILTRGAREVRAIEIEQHHQGRINLAGHVQQLISKQCLPSNFLENWNLSVYSDTR